MTVLQGGSEHLRKLLLMPSQVTLLRDIQTAGFVTSRWLAEKDGLSIAGASMRLQNLYQKGYLNREPHTEPTGGIEFKYWMELHERKE